MSTILPSFLIVAGIFSFAFVLWRKLKEDYTTDQIFYLTVASLASGVFAGFIIFAYFGPNFSFLGFWIGSAFACAWLIRKLALHFFEVVDGVVGGALWFLTALSGSTVIKLGVGDFFANVGQFAVSLVSLVSYYLFAARYRSFSWYGSGKIGFPGMAALWVFFATHSLLAFFLFWMLSSNMRLADGIASLSLSWILGAVVYLRSGRRGAAGFLAFFAKTRRRS